MSHEVFISYSHKDKAIADAVCANLENAGIRCWIAPRDITPGLDWPTAISNAIRTSRIMVLVYSAHSNSSSDVGRELILAANNNLIIIPFKIDDIPPEPGKEYYLARTHWLDAMNPPTQEQIDKLLSYVKSFLKEDGVEPKPQPARETRAVTPAQAGAGAGSRRKSLWLWGVLLLLALVAGGLFATRSLWQTAQPALATATAALTATIPAPGLTQSPEATVPSLPPVTITIWHQWSGEELRLAQAVFDDYEAAHPNVTIILSNFGTNMSDSLSAAIPSGQGPDIIAGEIDLTGNIGENAVAGNIIALEDYGISQDWLRSTYEPAAANTVTWDGRIWALPISEAGLAMIYNKKLASASDFPEDPQDFASLLARAKSYSAVKGIPLFCYQSIWAYSLAPVFFGFGVPDFVDEQGNAYLDTEQAADAMHWLLESRPYTYPVDQASGSGITALLQNQVAAVWTGSWALPEIRSAGIDYSILPMGRPFITIHAMLLTSNAVDRGHAEVAVDIMKVYTSAGTQADIAAGMAAGTQEVYIPAQTAALNDPRVTTIRDVTAFASALRQSVPYAHGLYAKIAAAGVNDILFPVWQGSRNPDTALAAAQAAIEQEIANMK